MNHIRNFFGWNAQKNINNPHPNNVENEFNDFEIFEKSQLTAPEQNYIPKALNIRNLSNNIISGVKKITSGVLDIVSYANPFNKAPVNNKIQQKADMLSDNESIKDLTRKIKLYFGIDNAYLKNKKDHLNVKNLMNLMKENQGLWTKSEKLESIKPKNILENAVNTFKKEANLFLISKNNAKILYNYERLAYTKALDDKRDKQQMQYLSQVRDVADKMIKKYENHFKKITSEISELENLLKKTRILKRRNTIS